MTIEILPGMATPKDLVKYFEKNFTIGLNLEEFADYFYKVRVQDGCGTHNIHTYFVPSNVDIPTLVKDVKDVIECVERVYRIKDNAWTDWGIDVCDDDNNLVSMNKDKFNLITYISIMLSIHSKDAVIYLMGSLSETFLEEGILEFGNTVPSQIVRKKSQKVVSPPIHYSTGGPYFEDR